MNVRFIIVLYLFFTDLFLLLKTTEIRSDTATSSSWLWDSIRCRLQNIKNAKHTKNMFYIIHTSDWWSGLETEFVLDVFLLFSIFSCFFEIVGCSPFSVEVFESFEVDLVRCCFTACKGTKDVDFAESFGGVLFRGWDDAIWKFM